MHQIDADEAGEGERAGDRFLRRLGHTQQQKGDQGDGDLSKSPNTALGRSALASAKVERRGSPAPRW
jgi:hypothetical protein